MRKHILIAAAALALCACGGTSDIIYRPAEQKLPPHIKRITVRPFANKTQQFGLEEKLTLKVIDEFLKNGEYTISQEADSQGVIVGEINFYHNDPLQRNVNLVPTVYKINVRVTVRFLDKTANRFLWEEPALEAVKMYSAVTLPGGLTEEQARESLWEVLAKDIVKRTVEGFGSVTSASQKKIAPPGEVQVSTPTGQ